ncbi:hypothetical protein EG68_11348 [Paragonimus skrjabini miyazakii]|uniref:Uncharacterized protein n=1 Tax=Paragonimus skrjabini miyazakii TaxID=59628 RepID=A0A8S9YDZ2_9TREM|nr:hypothetical protein EG68_11348 [Paragonimus skrjabini miyazakii]
MGKGYDTDEPEDLHTDKESKEDSSEFESFSDDVDEGSENVIAQRNVFGSDTESEGKSSPPQSHQHRSRSAKRTRPELSDSEQLEPEAAETLADKNSEQTGSPSAAEESPGPARASVSSPEVASDSDDYSQTRKSETTGRLRPITDSDEAEEPGDDDEDAQREPQSDQGEEPEGEEDEAEDDDEGQDPDETRIAVDFPLIRSDLGREMHLVKMPNFLSVETRPFDPALYEDELDEDEVLDEEGRTRLKLKVSLLQFMCHFTPVDVIYDVVMCMSNRFQSRLAGSIQRILPMDFKLPKLSLILTYEVTTKRTNIVPKVSDI